ncbi:DUF916 and DUF3324 domain-containing protein [Enterococcus villorum]|uniref:Cell wall surface anchor protein n=2 Tax=Enterococcus villorum TaxID=112904 RepID=A0A511J1I2_9ENTE|nr:DUF916 and DUF3324 domain-containing protein [Enterococcus villorum]EOH91428.1 hypothetical protein UAO_00761 [Enterococcus villorum ATCC 700913]EOW76806.1 hypothetical protein I591_02114 [Enterococcus villorum ATCC 700913]GEL91844.1 cell wall surface anchor protein [Enterococcus villorum]
MIKKLIYSIILSFIFVVLSATSVQADEVMGGYTVEPVPNSHQIDPDLGYFFLCEKEGTKDCLGVKLINSSDQTKVLKVVVTNANTNYNGLLDYTGKIKDNKDLKQPLTSIVKTTQSEVTVPAKSEVETTLDVKMPKDKFSGVIVGGIVISEKNDDSTTKHEKEIMVENKYNYTIGVVLTNDANTRMNQHISVSLEKVAPVLSDGRKIIQADILNPYSYIFDKASVTGEIREKNSDKILQKQEKTNVNIAPHSVYPFQFDWKKDELKAGDYVFSGVVQASGKKWVLEQPFKITSSSAKEINEKSIYHVIIPQWLKISWLIVLLVNIVGTSYLVFKYSKK